GTKLDGEQMDMYYHHNPAPKVGEMPRPIFLRRLRAAFELLERAAGERWIGVYGAATWNGFRHPPSARDALSLPDLFALAEDVAGRGHHFRVRQVPYNLALTEALTGPTPPSGREPRSPPPGARQR